MALTDWIRAWRGVWWRLHAAPHLLGGAARWLKWAVAIALPLAGGLAFVPWWLATADQLDWELMQREYTNEVGAQLEDNGLRGQRVYPLFSIVGDVLLATAPALALSLAAHLLLQACLPGLVRPWLPLLLRLP